MAKLLSVTQAASRLGITRARVRQLIHAGRIPAEKVGDTFVIREKILSEYKPNPPGRRKKEPTGGDLP